MRPTVCLAKNGKCMGAGFTTSRSTWSRLQNMPEHLIWHKWQSYITWVSGAALLMIVYWAGAELFLIDPRESRLVGAHARS